MSRDEDPRDDELLDGLRDAFRRESAEIDFAPEMVGAARRSARRRSAARAVTVGVPVAAAVVVATVLAVSGHSTGPRTTAPGAAGSEPSPSVSDAQETAYVVRRARAHLSRLAARGTDQVLRVTTTLEAGTAGSPRVHNVNWVYVDPRSRIAYQRSVDLTGDGAVVQTNTLVTTPRHGGSHTRVTSVDARTHTWFTSDRMAATLVHRDSSISGTQLGISSTEQQIVRGLATRRVVRDGVATIDGRPTVRLSVTPSPAAARAGHRVTLYVDRATGRPVREVEIAGHATTVLDWLATTPATIARTRTAVPAGVRRVTGPSAGYWTPAVPLVFLGYVSATRP